MAIRPIQQIAGSTVTVIDSVATTLATNVISSAVTPTTFANTDAVVPNAPFANATLSVPDWTGAPTAGTSMELWGLLKDVDGTDDDDPAPTTSTFGGMRYFGSWPMAAVDALQRRTIVISLAGINNGIGVDFYIGSNGLGVTANAPFKVKITPWTYGVVI
jgi:hypothetical protein